MTNYIRTRDQGVQQLQEENEQLKDRNEQLDKQLEDCQSKQLEDETIKESINNISDAVNSFKIPGCAGAIGTVFSCIGSTIGGLTLCGIEIPQYNSNNGDEEEPLIGNVVDEEGNIIMVPNIHANLKVLSRNITDFKLLVSNFRDGDNVVTATEVMQYDLAQRIDALAKSDQIAVASYTLDRIEKVLNQINDKIT